jgi:hypothetical protein
MFQVDWSPSALAVDLCQIYLDHAIHRKDITVAADRIDVRLRAAANSMGTELSAEGLRSFGTIRWR